MLEYYAERPDQKGGFHGGRALLDTGSTVCSLPVRAVAELALRAATTLRLEHADGSWHDVEAFDVFLTVPEHFSAPLRVTTTNSDEPLIGRDVMDTLRITFDGPRKELEIEPVL